MCLTGVTRADPSNGVRGSSTQWPVLAGPRDDHGAPDYLPMRRTAEIAKALIDRSRVRIC
jgi:hypothetical protein